MILSWDLDAILQHHWKDDGHVVVPSDARVDALRGGALGSRSFPLFPMAIRPCSRLATTFSLRRLLTPCVYTFLSDISPDRVRLTRRIAVLSECLQMSRENPPDGPTRRRVRALPTRSWPDKQLKS